jgi:hypothetical protein
MEKVKIIFLDFDGVITTVDSGWNINPKKIELLKDIIDATDAKIVIPSSWRTYDLKSTIENLSKGKNCNSPSGIAFPFCDRIIGITARMGGYRYNDNTNEDGRKPYVSIPRGIEIDDWIRCNEDKFDIISYVILDDDTDMLYNQRFNYVQTDTYYGLNKKHVKKAIKILNKNN